MTKEETAWMPDRYFASTLSSHYSHQGRAASCLDRATPLKVRDYAGRAVFRPADEIVRAAHGPRPYRLVLDAGGHEVVRPLRAAVRTCAQGFTVRLCDGRSVTLTGSHVIPGAAQQAPAEGRQGFAELRFVALPAAEANRHATRVALRRANWFIVPDGDTRAGTTYEGIPVVSSSERGAFVGKLMAETFNADRRSAGGVYVEAGQPFLAAVRADCRAVTEPLRPIVGGDHLLDGIVDRVDPQGRIDSVRLWADHPGWLQTESGIRLGHRAHELAGAWGTQRWTPATAEEIEADPWLYEGYGEWVLDEATIVASSKFGSVYEDRRSSYRIRRDSFCSTEQLARNPYNPDVRGEDWLYDVRPLRHRQSRAVANPRLGEAVARTA